MFAGSEVSLIELRDGQVRIRFAVAALRTSDLPIRGGGNERVFISGVEMVCVQTEVLQHSSDAVGALLEGQVWLNGAMCASLSVPCELEGDVSVSMVFANGASCRLTGRGVSLQPSADSRRLEWLSC